MLENTALTDPTASVDEVVSFLDDYVTNSRAAEDMIALLRNVLLNAQTLAEDWDNSDRQSGRISGLINFIGALNTFFDTYSTENQDPLSAFLAKFIQITLENLGQLIEIEAIFTRISDNVALRVEASINFTPADRNLLYTKQLWADWAAWSENYQATTLGDDPAGCQPVFSPS